MKRHVHQMGLRKEWLAEERAQLDKVEECMREMKALAAPFIAVGDRLVIGIVESLEAQEKVLVADRLKGIAEPDASGQPLEWLRASVQELWDEKIEFGHRRPKWDWLIDAAQKELERVQNLPPPQKRAGAKPDAGAGGGGGGGDSLDLDLDL